MSKQPFQKQIFRLFMLSIAILLLGGGVALLYQWHQGPTPGHASDDGVVGPPSLPAATVNSIFQRLGSPMVGTGEAVEKASRAEKIDDAFALAVWWTETNDGAAGVGLADRNPGSVRGSIGYPSAYDGYTIYPSYAAAVTYWFSLLRQRYVNEGLTTVSSIAHPYVGTSTSYLWAGKVIALMGTYRAEAPPPATPRPRPSPTIPPDVQRQAQAIATREAIVASSQGHSRPAEQAAQITRPVQASKSTSSPVSHANGNRQQNILLVLLELLVALALALLALQIYRGSARSAKLATLLAEDTYGKQDRPDTTPFPVFTTDSLAMYLPQTDDLSQLATNPRLPGSFPETKPALSMFFAEEREEQFEALQALYSTPTFTEHLSAFTIPTPAMPKGTAQPQPVELPAPKLPELPVSPLLAATQPFRRTRLVASQTGNRAVAPALPITPAPISPLPLSTPVALGAGGKRAPGLLSRYREMQTQGTQNTIQSGE